MIGVLVLIFSDSEESFRGSSAPNPDVVRFGWVVK
jgi:hypothetical protein